MRKLTQAEAAEVSGGCIPAPLPAPLCEPRSTFPDEVRFPFRYDNPLRPPIDILVPSAQERLQRFI